MLMSSKKTFTTQIFLFGLILVAASALSLEARSIVKKSGPSVSFRGDLWPVAYFENRFGQNSVYMGVERARLDAAIRVNPQWDARVQLEGDNRSAAFLADAWIRGKILPGDGVLKFGRIVGPYFDFVEDTMDLRWANLYTFTDATNAIDRRDEGVSLSWSNGANFDFALYLHNAGEPSFGGGTMDADIGTRVAAKYQLLPEWTLSAVLSFLPEMTLQSTEQTTVVALNLMHATKELKLSTEVFYYKEGEANFTAASTTGQYSLGPGLDTAGDQGLLFNLRFGKEGYKSTGTPTEATATEKARLGLGYYAGISQNFQMAWTAFYYSGTDAFAESDGFEVYWGAELEF